MREDSGFLPSGDGGPRTVPGHSAGFGASPGQPPGSSRTRTLMTHLAVAVLAAGAATGVTLGLDRPASPASAAVPAKATAFLRVTVTKARLLSIHPTSAVLSIRLIALQINGKRIEVTADQVNSKGASHSLRDVAIGAASGAAAGAVFGGPVGAVVGAGVGGLGGVVFDKATGHVSIPSETRFTYTLPEPLVIDYSGGAR